MCRFSFDAETGRVIGNIQFQYILCVGLAHIQLKPVCRECQFQYILCVGLAVYVFVDSTIIQISIHLMCRFSSTEPTLMFLPSLFQYILCVGLAVPDVMDLSLERIFQYILCVGLAGNDGQTERSYNLFQYILCVGLARPNLP